MPAIFRSHRPLYKGSRIDDLIPQRAPMRMIDAFYGVKNNVSYASYDVSVNSLFVKDGYLENEAIIEIVAQTAAAMTGYMCVKEGKKVPIGYIASASKFTFLQRISVGNRVFSVVSIDRIVGMIRLAVCDLWVEDELIAHGELKIFIDSDEENQKK